jgi:hypothetical protein
VGGAVLVRAIIVNHNTSLFAELALRSLMWAHTADSNIDLILSVVDNHSTDAELDRLKGACAEHGAEFVLSRWPLADAKVNTHGDVLRDFVLRHDDAERFLFVDSDIDFEEAGAISTLAEDLDTDDELWAVQSRFRFSEMRDGPGGSLDIWAGRPVALKVGSAIERWEDVNAFEGSIQRRCHPGATLCVNTPLFRRVAEVIGFSTAVRSSADFTHAGFFDTLGLASAAMATHGKRYTLSRATVHHFFMASYDDQHTKARRAECERRLERFQRNS